MKLLVTFFCAFLGLQLCGQAPIDKIFSLSPVFDAAGKILPAPGGNYLIFGKQREESVTYNYDFYLLMVDAAGNELWRKSYGTAGLDEGGSQGLARCAGGWVMVGTSGQNGWMVRVNEQGTVLWSKVIEIPNASNVKLTDVAPVPSGGFIASGYEGGCSGVEMLAVKVSDAGQVDWIEEYTDGEAYGLYVTEGGGAFMMVGENKILKALFKNHVYEEVAYDLIPLANPNQTVGSGIIGTLPEVLSAEDFLQKLADLFKIPCIRHTVTTNRKIEKVAVCGGAGSFLIPNAIAMAADAFITADLKYHEFFDDEGRMLLADIGHFESEQFTIDLLAEFLSQNFPNFAVLKTGVHTNPVRYFVAQ
jgi:putative NIF3 family GTP cyclohydrolase 1 type 2